MSCNFVYSLFSFVCRNYSLVVLTSRIMPNLTAEKLEKILDEKLSPLSEQLQEALATVKSLNTKYEKMEETMVALQEKNKALQQEYVSLKAQVLSCANDLKLAQKSVNDLEQYTRRDYI